jgi:tRNA nucleotidyltransferase (CCA-adding enzyme)
MNETALKVLKKINSNGYQAYLVGGYPRDIYIGRNSMDFDICTSATPKELKEIFGGTMLPTEEYGSVTLILNNIRFEITTFRKDIKYLNNRKPIEIEYVDNLLDDLKRRDFTMNTMCIDSNGNLIDLLDGKEDINDKVIRTVGNANMKIYEDSLRILRAIRFATTLNFVLDEDLKEAIKRHKDLLKSLSYYRKKEELDKIFSSTNSAYGIRLIKELGLDEPLELYNLDKLIPTTYLIGIWAQLDVVDKYKFNNTEKESIESINELMDKDILNYNNLYKYGLYISTIVSEIKGIDKKIINERYNSLYIHNKTEIKIEAKEICELLCRKPGKFLKEIFNDLEYKIVNKLLENDKEKIKQYILENY